MGAGDAEDRLDSWKEIASYLGRSVRTAKRWEQQGLPVRRQMHQAQGSVYAFRSEVDAWRDSRSVAAVSGLEEPAAVPTSSVPVSAEGGAPSSEPGLVVLPFSFHGRDEADAYLADGFTDETITMLSRVPGLRVISRTSSMALKGVESGATELARRLRIGFVLEGSVQVAGDQLRVNVNIVDALADKQLWASRYQGVIEELFEIQERIARRASLELFLLLSPNGQLDDSGEEAASWIRRPESNLVAWRCLQKARRQSMRWHKDAIDRAVDLLHRGIEEVGERSDLCAALGRAHLQYREAALDATDDPVACAETWLERAREADPNAPEVLQLAGWIAYARADIAGAVAQLQSALRRGANEAETLSLLANCLLISGRTEQAKPLIRRLLGIDPLTPVNQCMPGFVAAMEGRFDEAVPPYRRMLEMDPDNPVARLFLVWVLTSAGKTEQAAAVAQEMPTGLQEGLPARLTRLFVEAGRGGELDALDDVEDEMTSYGDMFPRLAAQAYALAGDDERAMHWLERAVERGFINLPYLSENDPLLGPVRGSARFGLLLTEVETRWGRFPDAVAAVAP